MKKLESLVLYCDERTFHRISATITIESTFVFNTILFTSMLHNAMSIYGSLVIESFILSMFRYVSIYVARKAIRIHIRSVYPVLSGTKIECATGVSLFAL